MSFPLSPLPAEAACLSPGAALLQGRRIWLPTPGVAAVETLPALLAGATLQRRADGADLALAWGRKPSARRAEALAARHGLPLWRLEDGFVRSLALGAQSPPWSVVLDDEGIYYDAGAPSRLERLVARPLAEPERQRARALKALWQAQRVSKYNGARDGAFEVRDGDVLVVDQTAGDASIAFGAADADRFRRMLEAALDEHPGARVLLKVHPDVLAGLKRGHFAPGSLPRGAASRIRWVAAPVHPPELLARVAAVYVVTSQMGFEALLWDRPVRCFGMPFYAGWGLSRDDQAAPGRRGAATLEQLVHAALVEYPLCLDPQTGLPCTPETLVHWMGWQRAMRQRFPEHLLGLGFTRWKQALVRDFVQGSQVQFAPRRVRPRAEDTVVLWGREPLPAGGRPAGVLRLEDGFVRSVGLGAEWSRPLSWVVDGRGLYYDASAPSDLEHLLQHHAFDDGLRRRAAALRQRIVAAGLSKYNLGGTAWRRPAGRRVVLVIGQVEGDASLRHGAPGVRHNLELLQRVRAERPDAWLVYKPHPDVVAGLRAGGQGEADAAGHCDEVLPEASITQLLGQVDEVHVMTSLTGFEALLRGVPVVAWGCPFYAGWGLTEDRHALPRRQRRLDLDELVAGALILYPTHVSRQTGLFCSPEQVLTELDRWRQEPPGPWQRLTRALVRQVARGWSRWRHGPPAGSAKSVTHRAHT